MNARRSMPVLLAAFAAAACTNPPPAAVTPASSAATSAPTAAATSAPVVFEDPSEGSDIVQFHPVVKIYSLIDVVPTDGGVEIRLGSDPGGGSIGTYRYVPIVRGLPDLDQETSPIIYVNTASQASVQLAGKRPSLFYHASAGFRSAPTDSYQALDANGVWQYVSGAGDGIGVGLFVWSNDRLLEWRESLFEERSEMDLSLLPQLRVARGDGEAPSIPAALSKRLKKEGFYVQTLTALRTGEVVAAGTLTDESKIGFLVWRDKLRSPEYTTAPGDAALRQEPGPEILGGDSLSSVRVRFGDGVYKMDGSAWVVESTVPKGGLPDVWFGRPLVLSDGKLAHARMVEKGPWKKLSVEGNTDDRTFVVDASGVIWTTDDDTLLATKPPASPQKDITEEDIVRRRKASLLKGGSPDATGAPPSDYTPTKCSRYVVVLEEGKIPPSDTGDYPAVRSALKGHIELAKARLAVVRERDSQFLVAQVDDEKLAEQLVSVVGKALKRARVRKLCAEPSVRRELALDFATGEILK
ncbi:MAG: hypothetical protein R3B70_20460 [Polyangiaceae bacterium]